MDNFIVSPCLTYRINLNPSTHEPLIATMRGEKSQRFDKDFNGCNEAILSNTQTTTPAGYVQCFPKSGLRYFYLVNHLNNQIVPNSMRAFTHKPKNMCVGISSWLEYQIYGKLGQ